MKRLNQLNNISRPKFHFKSLVDSFSTGKVKVIEETEGHYDQSQGGKWVPGETIETIITPAAIVPLNKDDLVFDEAGTYNSDDRKIYCYKKLSKGTVVEHTNSNGLKKEYKVLSDGDYSDFDTLEDGLFIYVIRRGDRN